MPTERRFARSGLTLATLLAGSSIVGAQGYPNKAIRIVTADPGGGMDFTARVIAQGLTERLRQQAIVDNRRGAGGVIAAETVLKAAPDGYTVLVTANGFWVGPLLQRTPYDPVKDFAPVASLVSAPNILVVHPSLPARSVSGLIALAKAKPGQLNYGSGGSGSSNHLAAELFKALAGVDMVRIVYKGSAQGLNDLVGGHVQVMFPAAAAGLPHVKSQRLRALAVTTAKPSALAPDLPTVAESLPGYETSAIYGMFAPGRTPQEIVERLNHEVVSVLANPEVTERLLRSGVEATGGSPAEFAAAVKSEMSRLANVIREAHIGAE